MSLRQRPERPVRAWTAKPAGASGAKDVSTPAQWNFTGPVGVLLAFGLVFAGTLAVALLQGFKPFYYDAANYWALGQTFSVHGHFSLLNFADPYRGYLLPLIDRGLQAAAGGLGWQSSSTAKLFNVLAFAAIGAVLAPALAKVIWPRWRWGVVRRIALALLLVVFWSGYLPFPLSDFPALALALLALTAVDRAETPVWMLVAGLACAAAIDIRPSYEPLAPILVVLMGWRWFDRRRDAHGSIALRALCLTLFLAGFIAVSLPQSLSAHRHFHTWSFIPGAAGHVAEINLTRGLLLQRYETYVGKGHGPEMEYRDEAGARLLATQPNQSITSTGQFLGLIFSHPTTMIPSLFRHVVNGLDQRYATPYVEHVNTGSNRWLRLGGFLLIFLGILRILWPSARRGLGTARWRYPVALALCCVTSVPTAMETRYMLPIYLLSYMLVLMPGWPSPLIAGATGLRRYRTSAIIAVAGIVFFVVVLVVVGQASQHLQFSG